MKAAVAYLAWARNRVMVVLDHAHQMPPTLVPANGGSPRTGNRMQRMRMRTRRNVVQQTVHFHSEKALAWSPELINWLLEMGAPLP